MNAVEYQVRIAKLISLHLTNEISPAEQAELDRWLKADTRHFLLFEQITDPSSLADILLKLESLDTETALNNVKFRIAQEGRQPQKIRPLWPRIAAAASILLILSAGGYYIIHRDKVQQQQVVALKPGTFKNDALPGNKAILTLSTGQQLAVTSIPTGHINQTNIQKTATGALVYDRSNAAPSVYNTLTVPRGGGKHELKLADGTLAILDAGSSIRFPVAFNGRERRVTVTGQVYFEVVHDSKQPFYVTIGDQIIEDVGTHFNINAFDGEIKTTLLEGSVKVDQTLLRPGQQAVRQVNGKMIVLNQVDEEEVIAWKNDLFKFGKNTSLQMVMNQLSRWYDLDVSYQGDGKNYKFAGFVPRDSKLSDVCKILEYSGVKFSLDGKKITVYQQ